MTCAACTPEINLDVDLQHANARMTTQTLPATVSVLPTDIPDAYDVLADIKIIARQRSAFGEKPTHAVAMRALQERAARLGAHAVVLAICGEQGMSMWSYSELRCHGRAIRLR